MKEILKIISIVVMENLHIVIKKLMKDNIKMVKEMVKEYINIKMVINIMVNGLMEN